MTLTYLSKIFLIIIALALVSSIIFEWNGSWVYSLILSSIVIWVSLLILLEKREPIKTITWIAMLILFPIAAIIFYFLLGRKFKIRKRKKNRKDYQNSGCSAAEWAMFEEAVKGNEDDYLRFAKLGCSIGNTPISFNTESSILKNGEETFKEIFKAIEEARSHIYLEFYIVRADMIGNQLKDLLIKKTKEGVDVKFIIDGVGSLLLSRGYIKELRKHGAKVEFFFPLLSSILQGTLNFRDHRKIITVDGKIGFIGGINIGDEYLGQGKYEFKHWRDTNLKMEYEAVEYLEDIFMNNWEHLTREKDEEKQKIKPYLLEASLREKFVPYEKGYIQIISSGPQFERKLIKKFFFSMITSAKESIYISSPYFVPDKDILNALKIASLSGIDVKLIVPSNPDHQLAFWATRSYFMELMDSGVQIYLYRKGFMHSKFVIVDNRLASIGSANMDIRSFLINFEVNAFLYKTNSITKLSQDFKQDLTESILLDANRFRKRSYRYKYYEACSRLFAPFL
jgi:cardiolipin synthase